MSDLKKKILVISNMYPSTKDPYYGTFVRNFYDSIHDDPRFSNHLIAIKGRTTNPVKKLIKYIAFYCKILFFTLFYTYDLIYVHTISHTAPPLRLISKLKKIKIIFNIHGNDLLPQSTFTKKLRNFSKPILEKAIEIVVPSSYYKNILFKTFPSINNNNIFISPSGGINSKFYTYHKDASNENTKFHIGYVSRIDEGKGWDILLGALSTLKNKGFLFKSSLYGRGKEINKMYKLINTLGLEDCVKYEGPCPYDKLPDIYKTFDVFVFPTIREAESLGLVGLEAMASGVPVIGSRIGGLVSYIQDGVNGFLFHPGNIEELATKIIEYHQMQDIKKKEFRENAYNTSSGYESSVVQKQILDMIYQKSIESD